MYDICLSILYDKKQLTDFILKINRLSQCSKPYAIWAVGGGYFLIYDILVLNR